jgi:hypothetical protein
MYVTPSATLVKGGEIAYVWGTVIDTYTFEGAAWCRFGDASNTDEENMANTRTVIVVSKKKRLADGKKAEPLILHVGTNDFNGNKKGSKALKVTDSSDTSPDRSQAWKHAESFFSLPPSRQPVEA